MSRRYYSSIAVPTTLSSGVTDSGTTFALAASTGFPSSYPFTLIVDEDTAYEEVVTVTASLGGNSFTVTRGSDGTTAQAHSAGAAARHGFSKRDLDEPNEHVNASAAVHGLTGTVVGTSDTQTLTNKTISTPTINNGTINGATIATATITQPTLTLKQDAAAAPTAEGDIRWDTDDNKIKVGDGTTTKTFSDDSVTTTGASTAIATHAALTATHGVAGAVVGTTDSQTLTNKTLTTPTLTLKQSTTPTPTAEGDIQWDTDDNKLVVGDGAATKIISPDDVAATLTNKTIDGDNNTLQDIAASSVKKEAWTTYTPVIGGTGWSLGNGSIVGKSVRIGNTVHFSIQIVFGTTTVAGSSSLILRLPYKASSTASAATIFQAAMWDVSAATLYPGSGHMDTSDYLGFSLYSINTSAAYAVNGATTLTVPFTWAVNDVITVFGTYETDAA